MQSIKFCGYASVFNNVDAANDVVLPGAFKHINFIKNKGVKLLLNHNCNSQIGWIQNIKTDDKGLYVEGVVDHTMPNFSAAKNAIKKGFCGLSIGYYSKKTHANKIFNRRYLESVALDEISIVQNPANCKAVINFIDL